MSTVCTSGVQRELQMEQKTGEGISKLTDNPTLPHGSAPKLTLCLSPAWLVAVCLRGFHYESKLAWSSQQFTSLTSVVHTTTPTALLLHLLRCGEKLLRWQETTGAEGWYVLKFKLNEKGGVIQQSAPPIDKKKKKNWGPDKVLACSDGAGQGLH